MHRVSWMSPGKYTLTCPGRTTLRIPLHELRLSLRALRVVDPRIRSHLGFPSLDGVDHPAPSVVVGRPVEPGGFRMREEQEPVRRISVQLPGLGGVLVQPRQPVLRGRRLEELLHPAAKARHQLGGQRPPPRTREFREQLERILFHVGKVIVASGWRQTRHLHSTRASSAMSGSRLGNVQAWPTSTCSSRSTCCSQKVASRALHDACASALRR